MVVLVNIDIFLEVSVGICRLNNSEIDYVIEIGLYRYINIGIVILKN